MMSHLRPNILSANQREAGSLAKVPPSTRIRSMNHESSKDTKMETPAMASAGDQTLLPARSLALQMLSLSSVRGYQDEGKPQTNCDAFANDEVLLPRFHCMKVRGDFCSTAIQVGVLAM